MSTTAGQQGPNEQALCCVCGTLRTLGARHPARVGDTPNPHQPSTGAQAAWMAERGLGPFDRCVCRAKCATCGEATVHAFLELGERRDRLEELMYAKPSSAR